MAFADTFPVTHGNERFQAVVRRLSLSSFTGGENLSTFEIVLGAAEADPISRSIADQSYSAPPSFQTLFRLMRPGSLVLDLGAHIGTLALAAAAAGCRVITVEASPHNVALLRASAARNQFSQLTVVQAAVSDRVGELEFIQNGPHGLVARAAAGQGAIRVPAVTVDALLAQQGLERVDLIKMDIEGSEVAAIRGMRTLLARRDAPPIFYESNGHTLRLFDETPDTLKGALAAWGYRSYLCDALQLIPTAAGELQVDCVVDCLAVKQLPAELRGRLRSRPLSREENIQRVLAASKLSSADHRAYLARALDTKGRDLLADRRVRQALAALSRDAEPEVRQAAAWAATPRAEARARPAPARPARTDGKLRSGIDYRILSAGININRGMGRYTQQQLREVLRLDQTHEYVLFCPPGADRALILPEIRSAPNVTLATIEFSKDKAIGDPNRPEKVLRFAEEYQDWIYRQGVDLYHATAPFLWHETVLPSFDVCPMVATFYDAIPAIFPAEYFSAGDPKADLYMRAARFMHDAERFIAISASARQDAVRYFGLPAERIDVAYPIADPCFQVLPAAEVASRLRGLRARLRLPEQYAMSVTHLHHSKGFDVLLDAYARLPLALRQELPLVITCHLTPFEQEYVGRLAHSREMADQVVITGQVSDDELAALYNAAVMLVHTARYEGFGLPVLEAMRCGTPVITMAASSLPEVAGAAAVLVPPDDRQGLASAIEALYGDPARCQALSGLGLEQARQFDPAQLGQRTLDCYRQALRPSPAPEPARPRLALFTPLPPQHSGVADYSAHILLGALARHYEVEVFVDDDVLPEVEILQWHRVLHHGAFARRRSQKPFQAVVYQLGASLFHLYMYRYLQEYPGIVVLHDLTWSYALHAGLAAAGHPDQFIGELLETEGAPAVQQYRQVMKAPVTERPAALIAFLDQHLMLKKIVTRSLALIVHLEASAEELRQQYGAERVFVIPHGAEDLLGSLQRPSRLEARAAVEAPAEAFLVGVFGILDPVKRVEVTLRAFGRLLAAQPGARLVIAGEAFDPGYRDALERLAESLGISAAVLFTGYVPDQALKQWVLACDVVVNLRYPSRRQMSGTLVRALAAGKPVIMTDLPEWRFLPEVFCLRLAPDEHEVEALAADLQRLATDEPLLASLSHQARAYYERELTPWQMAGRYQAVVRQIAGVPAPGAAASTAPEPALGSAALPLNKPLEVEDFEQAEIVALIRDIFADEIRSYPPGFPRGAEQTPLWAAAMALRTLRQAGQLRPEAVVLVAGGGFSPLLYYLTRLVGQVVAADRYLELGPRGRQMLAAPDSMAPSAAEPGRLVVQHMDARTLRFADQSVEAVILAAPLNELGSQTEIASALYEIGRVLKPGCVASLTLDYLLAGPAATDGQRPRAAPLSRCELDHFVLAASGLELMDELRAEPSGRTLAMPRRLDVRAQPPVMDVTGPPQLITVAGGCVATRLHLALRKTAAYPLADNTWARPSLELLEKIRQEALAAAAPPAGTAHSGDWATPAGGRVPPTSVATQSAWSARAQAANSLDAVRAHLAAWSQIRLKGWASGRLRRLPSPLAVFGRALARLAYLGHSQQAQEYFHQALLDHLVVLQNQLADNAGRTRELSERLQALSSTQQTLAALQRARAPELGGRKATDAPAAAPEGSAVPGAVTLGELVDLLQQLERRLPVLAGLRSVELSLQTGERDALAAGAAYLGGRWSAQDDTQRAPIDLWYHVDLSVDGQRDDLPGRAAARLAPGGYFVLATPAEQAAPAGQAALELAADLELALASGRRLRALAWRRRADAA